MTVTELPQGGGRRGVPHDRTPPQDVAAEQSVLGGMLLSKDAIADVVEVVRGPDFYRPAHETVYDTVLDLYARGEPADPVTVAAELQRRGELARVGGAPYLHTLTSSVPTAANAGYYAQIVRERAILRRLVEAGTRITQLGYGGDGDVDEVVDRAQAEVYQVTERRTSEDYRPLSEIMEGALDEIEAIGSRGGQLVGVPTGFADLDEVTNGLHAGQMVIVAARPGAGKALALDTALPTPSGWTTMGEIRVGDELLGADGRPTRVVAATGVMAGRPCFEVTFSDGAVLVADAEHQWLTSTPAARRAARDPAVVLGARRPGAVPAVLTTRELAATTGTGRRRPAVHSVALAAPLDLPALELPVPPYVLGVWLGDGTAAAGARVATSDPDVLAHLQGAGMGVEQVAGRRPALRLCPAREAQHGSLEAQLRALGVLGDKHVPAAYLRASPDQRRALLAGVLDAAGTVTADAAVRLTTTNPRLARDVHELVVGLGHRARVSRRRVRRGESFVALTVTIRAGEDVFRAGAKARLLKERAARRAAVARCRYVTAVRPVPSVAVRCVQVAAADHLYLAGRSMVATHNSTLALDVARSASIRHGLTSVLFSLEMSRNEIAMRLLSAEARVSLQHMRTGHLTDEDWGRIARKTGEVSGAPLFIDDSPNMSMMEIRAKCRRLKQRHDLKLVVLDYLQLLSSGKRVESRQVEVSEFSRSLKLLAKELDVPVVALSQLNRGPEQRQDKRPLLSDLRESGSLEQDSDMVLLLHREDMYEKESARAGEADIILAKHRNGPTTTVTVAFQGHYSRFIDMATG